MMKKFVKTAAVFFMALFVGLCIGNGGMEVKAAGGEQTDAQKTSVTVTWYAERNAVSYNVYLQEYGSKEEAVFVGNTTELTYTLANLKPGTKYYVRVRYLRADGTENYAAQINAVTLPDKLTGLKEEKWYYWLKQLNVEWDKQSAADGYEVKLYDNKKLKKTLNLTSNIARLSVKNNIVYKVRVRSYVTYNGKKCYSSWSEIYCLNQPMMKQLKLSGNKLQLKWDKVAGATQYKVYMSTKPNSGYKKVATVSKGKNSCTVKKLGNKKLSSKKKYYVYVEAICNKSGTKNTSGFLYYWDTKQGVKRIYRN